VTDSTGLTATKSISITIDVMPNLASVYQNLDQTGTPGWIPQDVNNDGVINVLDMIIVAQAENP
jgi:hypothetical protein